MRIIVCFNLCFPRGDYKYCMVPIAVIHYLLIFLFLMLYIPTIPSKDA